MIEGILPTFGIFVCEKKLYVLLFSLKRTEGHISVLIKTDSLFFGCLLYGRIRYKIAGTSYPFSNL